MTEPFRTRGLAVEASQRPVKRREAVRVVLRDETGALLLFRDSDPGAPGFVWWMTPGGGIDPGESPLDAAVREVAEETGLQVDPGALAGPIAHRVVVHGYSDQVTVQDELFFTLVVPRFTVVTDGHTPDEQLTITDHGWLRPDELTGETVWPANLAELASSPEQLPVELGTVEESSVPVRLGCSDPAALRRWASG